MDDIRFISRKSYGILNMFTFSNNASGIIKWIREKEVLEFFFSLSVTLWSHYNTEYYFTVWLLLIIVHYLRVKCKALTCISSSNFHRTVHGENLYWQGKVKDLLRRKICSVGWWERENARKRDSPLFFTHLATTENCAHHKSCQHSPSG